MKTLAGKQIVSALLLLSLLMSVGCRTGSLAREVVVCPQCQHVMEKHYAKGDDDRYATPRVYPRHDCPGCKGMLGSTYRGGEVRHECSVCEKSPFACPLRHPVTKFEEFRK